MMIYGVVNVDIIGSRKIKNRLQFQDIVTDYLAQCNHKYSDILTAPITMTLGDEWQIVLNKPSQAYNLIHEFQQLFWKNNIELYAGIGIGEINTAIYDDVRKMDGSCFHAARSAINIARNASKYKLKYSLSKANKVFFLARPLPDDRSEDELLSFYYEAKTSHHGYAMDEVATTIEQNTAGFEQLALFDGFILERTINLIIENNEILKSKMTNKQKDVYIQYLKLGSYRKIIEQLQGEVKETIGGISQKLNSASFFTIQRNHRIVSSLLQLFCSIGA